MKIIGINLGMLVVYTIIVNVAFRVSSSVDISAAFGLMALIALHVLGNILIGLGLWTQKKGEESKWYFLSAGVVLVIGFSSCWGSVLISG